MMKGQDMDGLKKDVDELKTEFKEFMASHKETNENLNKLVTHLEVREERDKQRQEKTDEAFDRIRVVEEKVSQIEIDRAREEQSRNFVYKYWPWLLIGAMGVTVAVTGYIKTLV